MVRGVSKFGQASGCVAPEPGVPRAAAHVSAASGGGPFGPIVKIAQNRLHVRADFDDYLFASERGRPSGPPGGRTADTRTKVSFVRRHRRPSRAKPQRRAGGGRKLQGASSLARKRGAGVPI